MEDLGFECAVLFNGYVSMTDDFARNEITSLLINVPESMCACT